MPGVDLSTGSLGHGLGVATAMAISAKRSGAKWRAFQWDVVEVDGHDHDQIEAAAALGANHSGRPKVVICHTTKGKGVSFMENSVLWHYRAAQGDELEAALAELASIGPERKDA